MEKNPIIKLSETCQRLYGENIIAEVLGKTGPDHCPVVKVRITLPNGEYEEAVGGNQKVAKQKAAKRLLEKL